MENKTIAGRDPKLGGSIKHNIVNPDLIAERSKLAFDQEETWKWFLGEETVKEMIVLRDFIKRTPDA